MGVWEYRIAKKLLEAFKNDTVTKEYIITELPSSKMSWSKKEFDKVFGDTVTSYTPAANSRK